MSDFQIFESLHYVKNESIKNIVQIYTTIFDLYEITTVLDQ